MWRFAKTLCSCVFITMLTVTSALAAEKIHLNAAAGNQGGIFYVGMGAVGKVIMEAYPQIDYTMFPSAGFTNIFRVQKNQSQIGVAQSCNTFMGYKGVAPFKERQDKVLGLLNVNTRAHTHIVVSEASGITSMQDIKDKKLPIRINVNPVGGNNEMLPRLIFEAYGIGWNDLKAQGAKLFPLSIPDSIDMMKDGRLDVDVYHGEEPAYKYADIMSATKIRFLSVDDDKLQTIIDRFGGGMKAGEFSPTAYEGLVKGIRSLETSTELVVNADMPEDLVYNITRALVAKWSDVATAAPLWGTMTLEEAPQTSVPLHPGAARYYREAGVLK